MSQVYGMGTITPLNYCPYPQHHSYILFNNAGQILGWKKKKITVTLCNFSGSAQSSWLNVDSLDIFHSSGTSPSSHLLKSFVMQAWSPMFNCAPADTLHFLTLLSALLLVLWPRWLIRLTIFSPTFTCCLEGIYVFTQIDAVSTCFYLSTLDVLFLFISFNCEIILFF